MASHLTGPAKDATHDAMPDIDSQAQDTHRDKPAYAHRRVFRS